MVIISVFILSPGNWALVGLVIEASLAGLFEARIFDWSLATQLGPRHREIHQAKLLLFIVGGHLPIPRILYAVGIPTHISLGIKADGQAHTP